MNADFLKKVAKLLLKLAVSVLAFYLVFQKINTDALLTQLQEISWGYFVLAVLAFAVSKLFGAFRLNNYYDNIEQKLPQKANLKLYWYGLFYNLVLPGGIGGDGYKVYWLQKFFKTGVKKLIFTSVLDRGSGLVMVVVYSALFLPFISYQESWFWLGYPTAIAAIVAFYFLQKLFFKAYSGNFGPIVFHALMVQLFQVVCVQFILMAIGIDSNYLDYWFIFMIGTFAFALPITMGGVGSRELVFVYSATYIPAINPEAGVLLNVVFHLVRAAVSLPGMYFLFDTERLNKEGTKA